MRIHAVACGYVLYFALKIGVSRGELACLLLAMGLVTAAEALNTSVEKLCDFSEPERNATIGKIKDMAAGGVLLGALFAAFVGFVILLRPALWQVLLQIWGTPWKLAVFFVTLLGCGMLVFVVPLKREDK